MLNFICSTDETQKLNEIYKCATADAAAGKSVFILVPEQYSMYAEAELIEILGLSAQNKIQILTFSRLCNLIFSKMGPLRTRYIDKAGKHIMTRRALQLAEKKLMFFRRNINQHGFCGLIQSAISEFKRYGISPSALTNAADKTDNERLGMKLRDLAVIYETFNALVARDHSNSEDNLSLIIPKIAKADFLSGSIYINFFRSFTPTEYAVLSQLMQKSNVCVALSCNSTDDHSDVFSAQINTYHKLVAIAQNNGISASSPIILNKEPENTLYGDLKHLKETFFLYSPQSYDAKPEHIHLVRPDNFLAEVTQCATLIRRLLREDGYSFNDFLILTGNMENYELLIPEIFEEYGINYFLDRKISLTESPFMRMIIAILEMLAYGFSYERVMRLARSGFFAVSVDEIDIFENYILAADITHSQWNSLNEWVYNPDPNKFDMNYINSVKSRLVNPVLTLASKFSGRKTVQDICTNLFEWLNDTEIPAAVNKKITDFRLASDTESAEQLRMVWNSFVSVTNQIKDYMKDEFSTFEEFYRLFLSACGELSVGMVPPTQDKVVISPVDMFRSTGSRVVIVLGAVDGIFPRDYKSEGLISDAERMILEQSGLTLAPDTYTQQKDEQFLIYSVLTTAREQLYIFSPLSDRDGKSLNPSEVLITLKSSLFPQLDEMCDCDTDVFSYTESPKSAFNHLSAELFKNGWNVQLLSPVMKAAYDFLKDDPIYSLQLERLYLMYLSKFDDTALTLDTAKELYGLPLTLSVSKLEKYNACAFSFFMQYGLIAQERMLGGLKSSDTGEILHSVLCDYFKSKAELNTDYSTIERDQCFSEISALVERMGKNTNENLYSDSHYYRYMMLRLKNIATATAWKMIKFYSQSKFRPTGFEISFGHGKTYPPYELDTQLGKVSLKGFIDRVDSAEIDGICNLAITDYKSSERKLDMALAEAGIHFQPLIYANALRRHIPDSQVAAMFYLQMNDPIIGCNTPPDERTWEKEMSDKIAAHGIIMDDAAVIEGIDTEYANKDAIHYIQCGGKSLLHKDLLEKALTDADRKAAESADNILSGKIDISPAFVSDFDPCKFCPYGSICCRKQ